MVKFNTVLKYMLAYITIAGTVCFSQFILEEALQTVMFGTWPAQDAQNWELVLKGCDTNRKINKVLKIVTYSFGWIQPFAFIAYQSYAKSMDFYIEALEAKIFARQPELFDGRTMKMVFKPNRKERNSDGTHTYQMGKVYLVAEQELLGISMEITGRLTLNNGKLFIDAE